MVVAGGVVVVAGAVVVAGGVVVVLPAPDVVVEEEPAGVSVVVVVASSPQAASVIRAEAPARIISLRMCSLNLFGWIVPMNGELGGLFNLSSSQTVNLRHLA